MFASSFSRFDARLMTGYSGFRVLRRAEALVTNVRAGLAPSFARPFGRASLASPKQRFTLREKRSLPGHLRIGLMAD